ncbi:MAG: hypothetical protein IPP36_06920 [Nitrosomonadales bacterium]|nr:hypothetical protein [Nitrosomonadales bacterium]
MGTTTLISAQFETNYGTYLSNCDDCSFLRLLLFSFPYYGINYTNTFVGTNGYLTFNSGDSTFTENVPSFTSRPRISAFFDDLYGARSAVGAVDRNFDALAGEAIYEYFTTTNLFDLDNGFVIFSPNGSGGYNVRTILPTPPAAASLISGGQ